MEDARDIIEQTVLVQLNSYEGLEFTGISGKGPFFCRVVAVDEVGMWVENKNFVTTEIRDSGGKPIPEDKRKTEINTVNILLPWRNVAAVVKFPDSDPQSLGQEILGEGDGGKGHIGFIK
ncbi:MAG: hypothetical protein JXB45_00605 [Candidatus Krumholzibacteriota bacterium]|nr:hypothetical protein [Candidatus Krumholzibacteriota bacterium]